MLDLRRVAGEQEEVVDRDATVRRRARRCGRRRRRRPARRRRRTDAWRCSARWRRGSRGRGSSPSSAAQPRARVALVARRDAVAEVGAASALAQIAAHRGHVAQLLRRAEQQRLREAGKRSTNRGPRATSLMRASAPMRRPPSAQILDAGQRQVVDVDEAVGVRDAGRGAGRPRSCRRRGRRWPGSPRPSVIARLDVVRRGCS